MTLVGDITNGRCKHTNSQTKNGSVVLMVVWSGRFTGKMAPPPFVTTSGECGRFWTDVTYNHTHALMVLPPPLVSATGSCRSDQSLLATGSRTAIASSGRSVDQRPGRGYGPTGTRWPAVVFSLSIALDDG